VHGVLQSVGDFATKLAQLKKAMPNWLLDNNSLTIDSVKITY
jgi:hypothetical protein